MPSSVDGWAREALTEARRVALVEMGRAAVAAEEAARARHPADQSTRHYLLLLEEHAGQLVLPV